MSSITSISFSSIAFCAAAASVFLAGAPRSGRLRLPRSERGQWALGAEPEPACFQVAKSVGQASQSDTVTFVSHENHF